MASIAEILVHRAHGYVVEMLDVGIYAGLSLNDTSFGQNLGTQLF